MYFNLSLQMVIFLLPRLAIYRPYTGGNNLMATTGPTPKYYTWPLSLIEVSLVRRLMGLIW